MLMKIEIAWQYLVEGTYIEFKQNPNVWDT
jgi:hypothetical protein